MNDKEQMGLTVFLVTSAASLFVMNMFVVLSTGFKDWLLFFVVSIVCTFTAFVLGYKLGKHTEEIENEE